MNITLTEKIQYTKKGYSTGCGTPGFKIDEEKNISRGNQINLQGILWVFPE